MAMAFAAQAMMSGALFRLTGGMPTNWINSRRLQVHGVILAACLWGTYVWLVATPGILDREGLVKGTDFVHFYTLGLLAREHRGGELYDMMAQSAYTQHLVPQAGRLYFVPLYGPQVSLLFAPFAALPYGWAQWVWVIFNAAVYGACCYAIWRRCPNLQSYGGTVFLLALAYPAFFHLIAWGQSSVLALGCFTLTYLALQSERMVIAGLAIGSLIYKPQLGLAAAVIFVLARQWRVVVGAISAALLQMCIGWTYYGSSVMKDYGMHLLHFRGIMAQLEPRPYQMHSLRSFWNLLIPWPEAATVLWVASAIAVLVVAFLCWRSAPLSLRFSGLLLATVLVSPHLTVYDLVILAPAFLLIADWVLASSGALPVRRLGALSYASYVLPLAGPLAIWTRVQLSVPAMVWLLWDMWKYSLNKTAWRSR